MPWKQHKVAGLVFIYNVPSTDLEVQRVRKTVKRMIFIEHANEVYTRQSRLKFFRRNLNAKTATVQIWILIESTHVNSSLDGRAKRSSVNDCI